ncbi:hypothetical protein [Mucilaginibacter sp.]|uniref:hypothetical protein n=1 Tax=Mucilaginibacter sp. TaxID=1882438 RepID=UPI0025E672DD|nr:hypothetical protein [Mucilaginibacter sp.]
MKKIITSTMLIIACALTSCQKEQGLKPAPAGGSTLSGSGSKSTKVTVTPPVTTAPATDTVTSKLPIGSLITTGTWKVTSYFEGTQNATDKFSTYTFTFDASGKITANQSGKILTGTWLYQNAVFYYGVPIYGSSPDGFVINLGAVKPLSLLSKNLFISKKTTTDFFLSSVNPAENAHVRFSKIAN